MASRPKNAGDEERPVAVRAVVPAAAAERERRARKERRRSPRRERKAKAKRRDARDVRVARDADVVVAYAEDAHPNAPIDAEKVLNAGGVRKQGREESEESVRF